MKRIGIVTWVVLLGILFTVGMAPAGQNGSGAFSGQQTLTAAEATNLAFMREEEKLARDVCKARAYFLQIKRLPAEARRADDGPLFFPAREPGFAD